MGRQLHTLRYSANLSFSALKSVCQVTAARMTPPPWSGKGQG